MMAIAGFAVTDAGTPLFDVPRYGLIPSTT